MTKHAYKSFVNPCIEVARVIPTLHYDCQLDSHQAGRTEKDAMKRDPRIRAWGNHHALPWETAEKINWSAGKP